MSLRINATNNRGFTIVELLIVIVVIAIIATITIVAYNGIQQRAAAAVLQSDLKNVSSQLGTYNVEVGDYPAALVSLNSGQGAKASEGTVYQYTYTALTNSYCISATSPRAGATTYRFDSLVGSVEAGLCPGHTAPVSGGGNAGVVTTLAGSGVAGFADGTGTAAQFNGPSGVAVDSSGTTVYVADINNHRIRKITSAGVVTTLAGSGVLGFADGIGTAAQFYNPYGVAVDSSGTVYVGEAGNNRIRKITSAGVVTTLAGSGVAGLADGTGTAAQFDSPRGVAVDSLGTVYVAESTYGRIRKVTSAGVVTTLAGSTPGFVDGTGAAARFNSPNGVAVDSSGTVYVADSNSRRIRKVTSAGVVTTLAGSGVAGFADGTGTAAQFFYSGGVTINSSGTVYVADGTNNRIRKIE